VRRNLAGLASIAGGTAAEYGLMTCDAHIILMVACGVVCGSAAGAIILGWRGGLVGAVIGFLAPFAYLPLWLVFDLPPTVDWDM
jgi:hypothetical protein